VVVGVPQGVPAGHRNHVSAGGAHAHADASPFSPTGTVDRPADDTEQVGELFGAALAAIEQGHQVRRLPLIELVLLTTQMSFGPGYLHVLPDTQPNLVGLELGDHRARPTAAGRPGRSGRTPTGPVERNLARGELVGDGTGSGSDRASRSSLVTTNAPPLR
jgi:hypothetical protein